MGEEKLEIHSRETSFIYKLQETWKSLYSDKESDEYFDDYYWDQEDIGIDQTKFVEALKNIKEVDKGKYLLDYILSELNIYISKLNFNSLYKYISEGHEYVDGPIDILRDKVKKLLEDKVNTEYKKDDLELLYKVIVNAVRDRFIVNNYTEILDYNELIHSFILKQGKFCLKVFLLGFGMSYETYNDIVKKVLKYRNLDFYVYDDVLLYIVMKYECDDGRLYGLKKLEQLYPKEDIAYLDLGYESISTSMMGNRLDEILLKFSEREIYSTKIPELEHYFGYIKFITKNISVKKDDTSSRTAIKTFFELLNQLRDSDIWQGTPSYNAWIQQERDPVIKAKIEYNPNKGLHIQEGTEFEINLLFDPEPAHLILNEDINIDSCNMNQYVLTVKPINVVFPDEIVNEYRMSGFHEINTLIPAEIVKEYGLDSLFNSGYIKSSELKIKLDCVYIRQTKGEDIKLEIKNNKENDKVIFKGLSGDSSEISSEIIVISREKRCKDEILYFILDKYRIYFQIIESTECDDYRDGKTLHIALKSISISDNLLEENGISYKTKSINIIPESIAEKNKLEVSFDLGYVKNECDVSIIKPDGNKKCVEISNIKNRLFLLVSSSRNLTKARISIFNDELISIGAEDILALNTKVGSFYYAIDDVSVNSVSTVLKLDGTDRRKIIEEYLEVDSNKDLIRYNGGIMLAERGDLLKSIEPSGVVGVMETPLVISLRSYVNRLDNRDVIGLLYPSYYGVDEDIESIDLTEIPLFTSNDFLSSRIDEDDFNPDCIKTKRVHLEVVSVTKEDEWYEWLKKKPAYNEYLQKIKLPKKYGDTFMAQVIRKGGEVTPLRFIEEDKYSGVYSLVSYSKLDLFLNENNKDDKKGSNGSVDLICESELRISSEDKLYFGVGDFKFVYRVIDVNEETQNEGSERCGFTDERLRNLIITEMFILTCLKTQKFEGYDNNANINDEVTPMERYRKFVKRVDPILIECGYHPFYTTGTFTYDAFFSLLLRSNVPIQLFWCIWSMVLKKEK